MENMDKKNESSNITDRLDAIIRLLSTQFLGNKKFEIREIYTMLNELGLNTTDIGKIFNKPPKDISSAINKKRK